MEAQIRADNASRINARIVAEAANGPATPEADAILADRGVVVVPDILVNAGGVVVSYFEWVQDIQLYFWDLDEINGKLETIMVRSFAEVMDLAQRSKVTMREAAMLLAVRRVEEAIVARGVYP